MTAASWARTGAGSKPGFTTAHSGVQKGSHPSCWQRFPDCTALKNLYQRLLLPIAGVTQQELARHVRYLKIENEILRSKLPKRVPVTLKEQNRLVKFGAKLGRALGELVTTVHPIRSGGGSGNSPNTAAFVERFIQTLQPECLDYFMAFGERHMNYVVSEMVAH